MSPGFGPAAPDPFPADPGLDWCRAVAAGRSGVLGTLSGTFVSPAVPPCPVPSPGAEPLWVLCPVLCPSALAHPWIANKGSLGWFPNPWICVLWNSCCFSLELTEGHNLCLCPVFTPNSTEDPRSKPSYPKLSKPRAKHPESLSQPCAGGSQGCVFPWKTRLPGVKCAAGIV